MIKRIPIVVALVLCPFLGWGDNIKSLEEDSKLNYLLGELAIAREDFEGASRYFDNILDSQTTPFLLERRIGLDVAKDTLKESLGYALELVELEPENIIAWNTLALIYIERNNEKDAIDAFNRSAHLYQASHEGENGFLYILRNIQDNLKVDQHIRIFTGLSQLNPGEIFPLLITAGMLIDEKRDDEAKEFLTRAYQLDDKNAVIYSLITHLYWRNNEIERGLALIKEAYEKHKTVEIGVEYIKALAKDFRYEAALQIAHEIKNKDNILLLEQRAYLEYALGNYDATKGILVALTNHEQSFLRVVIELFRISKETRTFRELLTILPIIDNQEYAYHHMIHQAHLALVDKTYPLFYGLFDEVRTRYPHMQEQLYFEQMGILEQENEYEILRGMLAFIGPVFSDESLISYLEAMAEYGRKDFVAMERIFRERLDVDPEDAIVLNALGYSLLEANDVKRYEEGLELIHEADRLMPSQDFIMDSIGWAYYKMGNYKKSVQYLEKAYNLLKNPEVIAHYIMVLDKIGKIEMAQQIFATYKKVYLNTKDYKALIEQLDWTQDKNVKDGKK